MSEIKTRVTLNEVRDALVKVQEWFASLDPEAPIALEAAPSDPVEPIPTPPMCANGHMKPMHWCAACAATALRSLDRKL